VVTVEKSKTYLRQAGSTNLLLSFVKARKQLGIGASVHRGSTGRVKNGGKVVNL
jgi:hypothetical protein